MNYEFLINFNINISHLIRINILYAIGKCYKFSRLQVETASLSFELLETFAILLSVSGK